MFELAFKLYLQTEERFTTARNSEVDWHTEFVNIHPIYERELSDFLFLAPDIDIFPGIDMEQSFVVNKDNVLDGKNYCEWKLLFVCRLEINGLYDVVMNQVKLTKFFNLNEDTRKIEELGKTYFEKNAKAKYLIMLYVSGDICKRLGGYMLIRCGII